MAASHEHLEALTAGYNGETSGVEIFRAFAERRQDLDGDRRLKLLLGECIEEQTQAQIASLLRECDAEPDPTGIRERTRTTAETLDDLSWAELGEWLASGAEGARPVYERIRDTAPDPTDPRLESIVRHVDVVIALARGEASGVPELEPGISHLDDAHRRRLREAGATWPDL